MTTPDPDDDPRRRFRFRLRSMMLAVVLVGFWLGLLADPMLGPVLTLGLVALGATLAILLAALALSWLGFGLFAAGDRVVGWVRRASNWPETERMGDGNGEDEGLVLVNGPEDSVQGPRARALFGGVARVAYKERGRGGSARPLWSALRAQRRGWVYCIDLGVPAAPLAALRRRLGPRVELVYEIGDPARPLLAHQGRPWREVALADALDRRLPGAADRLVFRGSYLADYFASVVPGGRLPPWVWLPDGADLSRFAPRRDDPAVVALRRRHGLEGRFVVGIVGSLHDNPALRLFYGWELAEALARMPAGRPVTGVVVGDGPGRPVLEAARDRLGLGDRLKLVGRVARDEVPVWVNAFDVGLSTQTDDPVGWGRTTAKLPEYLGCGIAVVCTDVGEAHRWLRPSGQTLPYRGLRDDAYPDRLAARLRALSEQDLAPLGAHNRALAERLFDYDVLRRRVRAFLAGGPAESPCPEEGVGA